MAKRESDLSLQALRGLRLFVGLLFAWAAIEVWRRGQPDGASLRSAIEAHLPNLYFPLSTWARGVLLKNPAALAFVWPVSLLAVGVLLLLDQRRRIAAGLGLFLTLHAWAFGPAQHGRQHLLMAVLLVALFYATPRKGY
jgi:uncharacterized membrane protein YphA (DoxX/SURF4 family)